MNLRFIDWIWHIRGSLALLPGQSSRDAFEKLDPLFRERDTSHERAGDTLTFRKKNQAPQDKMSVFDGGVLKIERSEAGPVLRYHLTSRALLFCFLAPLLFLGFAQLTVALGNWEQASAKAAEKSGKKADSAKKDEEKDRVLKLHPIDKALGAPEPEKPKKDKDKSKKEKKEEEEDKKPSPTPAYVFAAIFATLYLVGRILEDRLVKRLFRRRLMG